MDQKSTRVSELAWMEEEEGPGAAPAQETEEVVPFQVPKWDAALEHTQEQESSRGQFRSTAQRHQEEDTIVMRTGLRPYSPVIQIKTSAAFLSMLGEEDFSNPKQVPAMVKYIHQWLMANDSDEHRLDKPLLDLTKEHPADVIMTLLRVAPSCDRAAMTMWKTIMCLPNTEKLVQLRLLDVLGSWPKHSTCTSDGDKTGVFALAATMVMWKMLQVPCIPRVWRVYFPRLFVHLLFQVFFSTLDMTEEIDTFWKGCQEEHGLATSPNRFAVQTLKTLLCRKHYKDVVVAMERRRGWDMLLSVDTHHYAVGLMAREMSCISIPSCSRIFRYLLRLLSTQELLWDLPALAFLVEVLECPDLRERDADRVLQIFSRYLQSECRERRRLALRALLKLTDDPLMVEKMWSLTERLVELLGDADGEIVKMTVMVLSFIILDKDTPIPIPLTLQLAEALLPLFDHNNSQAQLLSILLFRALLTLPLGKKKKALETQVRHTLLPLFFHCHDENWRVAQVSLETLLCVAQFLKRRDLDKMVKKKKLWMFANNLLAEDRSRAAEHLRRALRYLQSPQEPLREAAIRFMGIAGRALRRKQEQVQLICSALEEMGNDISPSVRSLALQTLHILRAEAAVRYPILENLEDQLRRAWKTGLRVSGLGRLCCWSSMES